MTQRELAERSGVDTAMICKFEGGDREPSLTSLIRILAAMPGVNANWVLGLTPEKATSAYIDGYSDAIRDLQEAALELEQRLVT